MNQLEKARRYERNRLLIGVGEFCLAVLFLLLLLFSDLNETLRTWVLSLGGGVVVWSAVYFTVIAGIFELISLPLTFAGGYVLERRYGLLNQSFGRWLLDLIKSLLVGLVLGAAAVEILFLVIGRAGQWWWLAGGGAFAFFFIILAQLTPVVILPLFFRFKPLDDELLSRRLIDLCERTGVRVIGVYEWTLSAKTNRANAALMGFGSTRRVVLSDTLLDKFTPSEVEVVLAHELGHQHMSHLGWGLAIQAGLAVLAFFWADWIFNMVGPSLGLYRLYDPASLPLLLLCFMVVGLVTLPLSNMVLRRMEMEADFFALRTTGLSGSFISAMERLAALNLTPMRTHPLIEFIFSSHPAPAKRIDLAREFRRNEAGEEQ